MPLIYFLRHGQTDYNASKRIQGELEIPINAKGREQARRNGGLLAELIGDKGRFDFVASPLLRATQTMEVLRSAMGLPLDGYRTDCRLKEISFGEWAGLNLARDRSPRSRGLRSPAGRPLECCGSRRRVLPRSVPGRRGMDCKREVGYYRCRTLRDGALYKGALPKAQAGRDALS